jgi:hypothetical protein
LLFLQQGVNKAALGAFAMFAPAPVADLSLSWAYLTATRPALPMLQAGQNPVAGWSAALNPVNFRIFFREPNPNIFHLAIKKEGV